MYEHRGYWYRKGDREDGRDLRHRLEHVSTDRWDSTRRGVKENTHEKLKQLEVDVKTWVQSSRDVGATIRDKDYDGFGPGAHSKYAMLRLMYKLFFEEFGRFAVLHVSYNYDQGWNTTGRRLVWTNRHLFTRNTTAFIFLNESHMMSMRWTDNGEIVIRDTNLNTQLPGLWEFLRRFKAFGGMKFVLDDKTPQQGMGRGGCGAMSMVNALLPDDIYAKEADAEIIKLPYIEEIYAMIVRMRRSSPYDLASDDWRHASLGLMERGPRQIQDKTFEYDVDVYNAAEAYSNQAWSHVARFRLNSWLSSCMAMHHCPIVHYIMRLYFQTLYETCSNEVPPGEDLDNMEVYTDFNILVNLLDRCQFQQWAYEWALTDGRTRYSRILANLEDVDAKDTGGDTTDDSSDDNDIIDFYESSYRQRSEWKREGVCRILNRKVREKQSQTNALTHYCARIYKLVDTRLRTHFAMMLGHAWTSRLEQQTHECPPYSAATGDVPPWQVVDDIKKDDDIYFALNKELTLCENCLWEEGQGPRWKWGLHGLPQTSHHV